IAHVLPEHERIAELVLEQRADRGRLYVVLVEPGLAREPFDRNGPAFVAREARADLRQKRRRRAGFVVLITAEDREGRAARRFPGERGREQNTVVIDEIGLRLAVSSDSRETIQPLAVL